MTKATAETVAALGLPLHPRVARILERLAAGEPVQSPRMDVIHCRIEGRAVRFCSSMKDDPIQRSQRKGGFYERPELDRLKELFPEGGTFVDIGANVGNHSLFAAMILGAGRVVPVEPNRKAFELLIQNVLLNDLGGVIELERLGVGLGAARGDGFAMTERKTNLGRAQMVAGAGDLVVLTGDALLADVVPDLVKIDVEGMEIQVLAGMERLFARCRPLLMIEVDRENIRDFHAWAASKDYEIFEEVQRYRANVNYLLRPMGKPVGKAAGKPAGRPEGGRLS